MKYNKKYLLDEWVENHISNEEDYYNCPECDYALDYMQDEEGDDRLLVSKNLVSMMSRVTPPYRL